ncbi:nucleotidyl transferase AbiEii/AbiGii toxin family protein [Emcibacter nanhaiensis]|uniref:Nucleotidyl transferase AbiEii/AbiGii toxin family protein n=1 Tax=Emcibacter nanhaiensis TaxID=1505037 RepID=A0A501PQE0_9PROT|nr:nucleotidyl transferase AbiEii/AbiGii toxin family protein [Emcibacter nanhaiensis]TPD62740.1 nucleotidyl transferase AbiEii/AbiGii toxin family protein [Emcibacter nanhaiensis]
MPPDQFLHDHDQFDDLIRIVAEQRGIDPALAEKDYWIMHCLYGLQQLGMAFELKGGTSLSKGYGIIDRFSEDIDIRIEPPTDRDVKTRPNHKKPAHVKSRRQYYEWLAETVRIEGIEQVARDTEFDDERYYRSGGIRLYYPSVTSPLDDLKHGILLEVGFDDVTPNMPKDISSWAYDLAADKVEVTDNRARGVLCYHPGYTLIEKLQTISTKYRNQQESSRFPRNFMRHYYDVYALLQEPKVQDFIGTEAYHAHKAKRFRTADNPVIDENEAFLLSDPAIWQTYEQEYYKTPRLYYTEQPAFDAILSSIHEWADRL